ncbi:DNA-binding MarR family transcriptional regulator [Azomonas macrocytogenes]|uniref:DNA-binding MarR family transcriptional regulator n=2 Tax=Azomonas macrocytogenes TaxID=69962 RepID=A0A839SXU8_AZOMA|nr:DNA-binding MarR family transcriptional regulator [Azomonas macrocytogenes]
MLVISAIDRLGDGVTPSTLAASENMRSSNLAAVLRELEASGLIIRTPDALDRRKVRIRLTDAGRDVLQLSRQRRDDWLMAAITACLTDEECERLVDAGELLERLTAHADPIPIDNADP